MGARSTFVMMTALAMTRAALADPPKPRPVDISAYKDKLQLFSDASGGTYAVLREKDKKHVFYGTGSTLYQQIVVGSSSSGGDTWTVSTYAPRVWRNLEGYIEKVADGSYRRYCPDDDGDESVALTPLSADATKQAIAKSKFVTTATFYVPVGLGRDDRGTYYYVDQLYQDYGGKGYRLFVGKKGRMKEIPLTDVADDTGGYVFSTKTGDLRMVMGRVEGNGDRSEGTATWYRGDKETKLVWLGTFMNTALIHSELGVYKFLGTLCDTVRPRATKTLLPQ